MSQPANHTPHNYKVICNVVLFSTYFVIAAISILLLISLGLHHSGLGRLAVCGVGFWYIVSTQLLLRRNHAHVVAYLLVAFYMFLATGIVWTWGINTPIGTLILGLAIVLAGILLTSRYALKTAVVAGLVLIGTQTAINFDWHTPDTSWTGNESSFGDAIAYCVVFGMMAVVSWLYSREMERSLLQAKQAEIALLQQKATLKVQIKKRTEELRQTQLEEMQHMYRFAELGQLGVTLLHDLANHLTALTLEIEGMKSRQHSAAIARAREITGYLEDIVDSTRARLQGSMQEQTFNIIRKTSEVIAFLHYKAAKAGVIIDWQPPARAWKYTGDPTCFCQTIAIIINNAIDAYSTSQHDTSSSNVRKLVVTMQRNETHIIIKISDWGKGIAKSERKQLFKPFHSTKKSGLGIGLFIAQQTVETNFSGTIALNPRSDHTEFIIKLPLGDKQ